MAFGDHFKWPKITFDRIYRHFRSMRNFIFGGFYFTKRLPAAILDERKSRSNAFLAILDQYATFNFFEFFSQNGSHFGWPKITFDRIYRHFRSIRSFFICFTKWPPTAILDDRKSLSIASLAISDQYATFFFDFFPHFGFRFLPKSIGTSSIVCQWLHQIWIWSVYFLIKL